MANRDYPLAPTYMNGGDPPKKLRKQTAPSPDARKPKKDPENKPLTPEQMAVISRSHKATSDVQQMRAKGVRDSDMPILVKRMQASSDSANVIRQQAWKNLKKK